MYNALAFMKDTMQFEKTFEPKKILQWENFHPLWLQLFPPALRERTVFFQMRVVLVFKGWTRKCINVEKNSLSGKTQSETSY